MAGIVSMFRGVNLGPHRRIKMDALRGVCAPLGLQDPRTYVQSGNVVFQTKEGSLERLALRIEDAFERAFGFRSEVILRTAAEMEDVIARNPLANRRGIEPARLLVTFLGAAPGAEARAKILEMQSDPEEIYLDGRELYIYFANGMARPKLSMAQIDRVLKTRWTGRNWNTVMALSEMASSG